MYERHVNNEKKKNTRLFWFGGEGMAKLCSGTAFLCRQGIEHRFTVGTAYQKMPPDEAMKN